MLRKAGLRVEHAYAGNLKKRMMKANKVNAFKAVIIGSEELANGTVTVKDLDSGQQDLVKIDNLVKEI